MSDDDALALLLHFLEGPGLIPYFDEEIARLNAEERRRRFWAGVRMYCGEKPLW